MTPRRLAPLVLVLVLALVPMGAGQASPATNSGDAAAVKKRPKCKKGVNKKKCRCPKGKKLKRVDRGYRCKKVPAAGPKDPAGDEQQPGDGGETDPGGTDPGGTDDGGTNQGGSDPTPTGPTPEEIFADILSRTYVLRNYQVQNGNQTNNHSEEYAFCNDSTYGQRMSHEYEGIAYIYKSSGPWRILSGTASADGSTGSGTFEFTQETANFQEEVGKVQVIDISWTNDTATIAHPEIGTYNFAKTVSSTSSCTRTS